MRSGSGTPASMNTTRTRPARRRRSSKNRWGCARSRGRSTRIWPRGRGKATVSVSATSSRHDLQTIARRAMLERGFLPDFGAAALTELGAIPGPAATHVPSARELSGLLWASIDNDTSLDLDQLSVAEPLADGKVKVLVAIADVDALVGSASAIDAHAQHNATSVYTVAQVFPMLPERLSTDLTSLREGQERLAIVSEVVTDPDGAVVGSDLYRATVVNHGKLAYNAVAAWLAGHGPMPPRVAGVPGLADQLPL